MNIGNMGFWEILIIMVLVLLLFGAKRLPEMGSSIGKGIREFKKSLTEVERSVKEVEREPQSDRLAAGEAETIRPPSEEKQPEPKRLLS